MTGRVVILAHSHPSMSQGGGEIAAHRQFQAMQARGYDARFVGLCSDFDLKSRLFDASQQILEASPGDYVLRVEAMSAFTMETDTLEQEGRLVAFLESLEPDILHLHHIWKLGSGAVRRLKAARPQMKIYFTVHEYTLICALHGQMVKADGTTLCHSASPMDCARCFPERTPVDFILRQSRLQHLLSLCDRILSPSQFLADRLAAWGVPGERIEVIENGLLEIPEFPPESDDDLTVKVSRFGYFGNGTPTKGLNVLVDAARILARREGCEGITVDIYGVTAERFRELWPDLGVPGNITFRGRYQPAEAVGLMRRFGWVVIPSIWWENSPVIIQEARAARTPIIYSDLGGMAEKAAGAGLPFPVGDAVALAQVIERAATDVAAQKRIKGSMAAPTSIDAYMAAWEAGSDTAPLAASGFGGGQQ